MSSNRAARRQRKRTTPKDDFLGRLLSFFPDQVSLVGRYTNTSLGFADDGPLRVFLPDFHWMSVTCLGRYTGGYQFNGNKRLHDGAPTFATLLKVLEQVAHDGGAPLEVFQLGDRYDLWRELTTDDHGNVMEAYRRIRQDPGVSGLADRLDTLGTKYIRGNHDHWLGTIQSQIPDPGLPELETNDRKIYLTHGHRYDNIERLLPDDVQAFGVGLAPKVKPAKHDIGPFTNDNLEKINAFLTLRDKIGPHHSLYPSVRPDGALPITTAGDLTAIERTHQAYLDLTRFWHGDEDRNDFEHVNYLTFGDKILQFEQSHKNDHVLHVIGHTHHARLLVDRLPGDKPFVIMDTGGWIEDCTIRQGDGQAFRAPSAQFGTQQGNDIRLYQLGGTLPGDSN